MLVGRSKFHAWSTGLDLEMQQMEERLFPHCLAQLDSPLRPACFHLQSTMRNSLHRQSSSVSFQHPCDGQACSAWSRVSWQEGPALSPSLIPCPPHPLPSSLESDWQQSSWQSWCHHCWERLQLGFLHGSERKTWFKVQWNRHECRPIKVPVTPLQ